MVWTRVKICGITRVEDAAAAADAGADAIGMVFYEHSPRCVSIGRARRISAVVGPFVARVALVVNASHSLVQQIIDEVRPDLLQFHGDESAAFCDSFSRPYIKAIRMHPDIDPRGAFNAYPNASAILFDAWHAKKYGGTGETFDWQRLPQAPELPLVLAGGLSPKNVAEAVRAVRPYAVDVSGGVEHSPGIKDARQVQDFVSAVKNARQSI